MLKKYRLLIVLFLLSLLLWKMFPAGKLEAGDGYCARLHEFSQEAADVNLELGPSQWTAILGTQAELFDGRPATPLFMAVHFGCLDTVQLLLEKGADVHLGSPFMLPILYESLPRNDLRGRHDVEISRLLLEAGADVNQWFSDDCFPDYGYALHIALTEYISEHRPGYFPEEMVRLLLEYGADVNVTNAMRSTPLHWASQYHGKGGGELVRLLLGTGEADVDAVDIRGNTPLQIAVTKEIADILTAHGAREVRVDIDGKAYSKEEDSLRYAILANDHKLLKDLIKRGVDINSPDENGDTALHLAASGGYMEALILLLKAGADVNAKNNEGLTPAEVAGNSNIGRIIEGKDNFRLRLFSIGLRELGLVLGLIFAFVIHGLTWMLRQRKMAVASMSGAVVGGISYVAAFIFLSNPYAGEIHGPLSLILAASLLTALVLAPLHAAALQEPRRQCFFAVYLDLGAGLFGSILVARQVESHIQRLFPWEGALLYMFESSFRPVLLATLAFLLLARPLLALFLKKRTAAT